MSRDERAGCCTAHNCRTEVHQLWCYTNRTRRCTPLDRALTSHLSSLLLIIPRRQPPTNPTGSFSGVIVTITNEHARSSSMLRPVFSMLGSVFRVFVFLLASAAVGNRRLASIVRVCLPSDRLRPRATKKQTTVGIASSGQHQSFLCSSPHPTGRVKTSAHQPSFATYPPSFWGG